MKRFGSATWNGDLREGKGSVSTESRALESHPYTFFSRYGEKPGTNPEELLGAAHAACFTMSFVRMPGMAEFVPEQLASKSEAVIDKDGYGFSITSVHLTVAAKIPGIDHETFQSIAAKAKAKAGCPVSLKGRGSVQAALAPSRLDPSVTRSAASDARKFIRWQTSRRTATPF